MSVAAEGARPNNPEILSVRLLFEQKTKKINILSLKTIYYIFMYLLYKQCVSFNVEFKTNIIIEEVLTVFLNKFFFMYE